MSFYLKKGQTFWPTPEGAIDLRNALPVGTYTVRNSMEGYYLEVTDEFNIEGKIYGKTTRQTHRILSTFQARPHSTGVLLNGEKGSGKTMLAKMISAKAKEMGISTLIVNSPHCGDSFNSFMTSITEPCVVIFDEFEKVYDDEQQEAILTLLDGVFPSKKLNVLTVNDKYKVNSHLRNRPGRIFYMIEYKGLDAEFIREYCEDNLLNKDYIQQVCRLTLLFDSFNFDMLKALVEEMNRYNESPNHAMEMLNAKPIDAGQDYHNVEVFMSGTKMDADRLHPVRIRGNPIAQEQLEFYLRVPNPPGTPEDEDENSIVFEIAPHNLKKIDADAGTFTYIINEDQPNAAVFVITREKRPNTSSYNWLDAF
jgi:SpoVK/Ycf46/Vps4 family AAA+-type ATPase